MYSLATPHQASCEDARQAQIVATWDSEHQVPVSFIVLKSSPLAFTKLPCDL